MSCSQMPQKLQHAVYEGYVAKNTHVAARRLERRLDKEESSATDASAASTIGEWRKGLTAAREKPGAVACVVHTLGVQTAALLGSALRTKVVIFRKDSGNRLRACALPMPNDTTTTFLSSEDALRMSSHSLSPAIQMIVGKKRAGKSYAMGDVCSAAYALSTAARKNDDVVVEVPGEDDCAKDIPLSKYATVMTISPDVNTFVATLSKDSASKAKGHPQSCGGSRGQCSLGDDDDHEEEEEAEPEEEDDSNTHVLYVLHEPDTWVKSLRNSAFVSGIKSDCLGPRHVGAFVAMQPEWLSTMCWMTISALRTHVAKTKPTDSGIPEGALLERLTFMPLQEFVEPAVDLGATPESYEGLESTTNVLSARKARKPENGTVREDEDGTCRQGGPSIELRDLKKKDGDKHDVVGTFVHLPVTKEAWTQRYGGAVKSTSEDDELASTSEDDELESTSADESRSIKPHPLFAALGSAAIGVQATKGIVDAPADVDGRISPVLLIPQTAKLAKLLAWCTHFQRTFTDDRTLFSREAVLRCVERLAVGFEFVRRLLMTMKKSSTLQAFLRDISENCNLSDLENCVPTGNIEFPKGFLSVFCSTVASEHLRLCDTGEIKSMYGQFALTEQKKMWSLAVVPESVDYAVPFVYAHFETTVGALAPCLQTLPPGDDEWRAGVASADSREVPVAKGASKVVGSVVNEPAAAVASTDRPATADVVNGALCTLLSDTANLLKFGLSGTSMPNPKQTVTCFARTTLLAAADKDVPVGTFTGIKLSSYQTTKVFGAKLLADDVDRVVRVLNIVKSFFDSEVAKGRKTYRCKLLNDAVAESLFSYKAGTNTNKQPELKIKFGRPFGRFYDDDGAVEDSVTKEEAAELSDALGAVTNQVCAVFGLLWLGGPSKELSRDCGNLQTAAQNLLKKTRISDDTASVQRFLQSDDDVTSGGTQAHSPAPLTPPRTFALEPDTPATPALFNEAARSRFVTEARAELQRYSVGLDNSTELRECQPHSLLDYMIGSKVRFDSVRWNRSVRLPIAAMLTFMQNLPEENRGTVKDNSLRYVQCHVRGFIKECGPTFGLSEENSKKVAVFVVDGTGAATEVATGLSPSSPDPSSRETHSNFFKFISTFLTPHFGVVDGSDAARSRIAELKATLLPPSVRREPPQAVVPAAGGEDKEPAGISGRRAADFATEDDASSDEGPAAPPPAAQGTSVDYPAPTNDDNGQMAEDTVKAKSKKTRKRKAAGSVSDSNSNAKKTSTAFPDFAAVTGMRVIPRPSNLPKAGKIGIRRGQKREWFLGCIERETKSGKRVIRLDGLVTPRHIDLKLSDYGTNKTDENSWVLLAKVPEDQMTTRSLASSATEYVPAMYRERFAV
eukprot:CAMPEP_0118892946 /NCGR_PEP_ID=MMETSP1166-20130328/2350_1 /TAXON_ID=1104430 /ORGANISM="Chrysoreinhardia sp, Strain CCMP3193" /LENGTH=1360 /DNA_ID=CAMNT_0006831709 /DNA_START=18 /DNA_END=4100 /DNA_ORIENTATION=-